MIRTSLQVGDKIFLRELSHLITLYFLNASRSIPEKRLIQIWYPSYKQGHDVPIAFPFHHDCQTILREHLGVDEFDKEVLYETLNGLFRDGEDPTSLEINYGAATEFQEQYWVVYHGFEYLVFSPLNIPQLLEYYGSLPKRVPQKVGTEDDREVSNTSWKMRLMGDMPWLYDFPKPSSAEAENIVDWERVYRELYVASDATSKDKIQGLANRRRIWEEQCPQISSKYLATKMKRDLTRNRVPLPLKDASSIQSPSLILPSPKSTKVTIAAFIHSYEAISYVDPVVVVCWTANGDLAGLDVRQSDGLVGTTNIGGPNDTPNKFDGVLIPRDDWLTGIIVTSKEDSCETQDGQIRRRIVGVHLLFTKKDPIQLGVTEGDQRLIYVSDAHFVVGFKVFRSLDGTMSAFALLQQPTTKALGVERIASRNSDSHNLDAMKYLWRKTIPPPKLQISDFLSGYWAFDMKVDTSPMEALIFGATEDEMADITAFSVDVHFGGFEIEYGSRPTRTIAPRREVLRTLRIDGGGGERIIALYFCVHHLPTSMRLVTNRGRQLVLGQPTDWNETRLPPTSERGDVYSLSGIYRWWSGQHPTDDLKAVGCLFSPPGASSQANKLPDRSPRDSHGLYWDSSAYSPDIIESGQIVPLNSRSPIFREGTVHMPGQVGTVSWLDCSRPLAEVCVISYRQTTQDQLSLLGITFVYADKDSEEVAAGLGRFRLSVSDTEEVHVACRCAVTDTLTPGP